MHRKCPVMVGAILKCSLISFLFLIIVNLSRNFKSFGFQVLAKWSVRFKMNFLQF